jgi:hypothetical protein
MVIHSYNPSYSGGGIERTRVQGQPGEKVSETPPPSQ